MLYCWFIDEKPHLEGALIFSGSLWCWKCCHELVMSVCLYISHLQSHQMPKNRCFLKNQIQNFKNRYFLKKFTLFNSNFWKPLHFKNLQLLKFFKIMRFSDLNSLVLHNNV
jgi:hypothetical protein